MCLSLNKQSLVHGDSAIILKSGQVFTVAPWTTGQDKRLIGKNTYKQIALKLEPKSQMHLADVLSKTKSSQASTCIEKPFEQ